MSATWQRTLITTCSLHCKTVQIGCLTRGYGFHIATGDRAFLVSFPRNQAFYVTWGHCPSSLPAFYQEFLVF